MDLVTTVRAEPAGGTTEDSLGQRSITIFEGTSEEEIGFEASIDGWEWETETWSLVRDINGPGSEEWESTLEDENNSM